MNIRFLLLLTLSTLLGCKNDSNGEGSYAYFGGEIINPTNDYVILKSPDDKSDTLYLDGNNRFIKKLTSIKAGLYTFIHGEYQRILLEPKDSIMLRLNTIDFDESLVFTGDGARKNNFLIAAFLENENDNKKFMKMMWDMEPTKFEDVLDTDRAKKLAELKEFLSKKEYSNLFKIIAESNINYEYYFNKELYPFGYYGYNNLIHFKDLPENFYDFRANIDYNKEELVGVIPYYRFLFCHFNNLALSSYYENASHNVVFDNKSAIYNLEKLRLMDSLVKNQKIKNHLLKFTTQDFIAESDDSSEIDEVLNSFLKKSSSDLDKSYIEKLALSVNKLKSGNQIPNIKLVDYNDGEIDITSLISKPTVIYFWSSNLPLLMRNSHAKIQAFENKFPELNFVAININDDDRSHWKSILTQYKFNPSNEYQFQNPIKAMSELAINSVNRSIILDSDGTIITAKAMLFTSEFERELELIAHKKKAQLQ